MKFSLWEAWGFGFFLIIVFVVFVILVSFFGDYVFHRIGISRNSLIILSWIIPMGAGFFTSYYARKYKVLLSISHILSVCILIAIGHYLVWFFGIDVDFPGFDGALFVAFIYLFIAVFSVGVGLVVGLFLSVWKSRQNH